MARKDRYCIYINNEWKALSLESLVKYLRTQNPRPRVWSARLSTGLLGKTNCPSGNNKKAPKGYNEVLLAAGDEGLRKLIDLGFITCPKCLPENVKGFWNTVHDIVQKKYGIKSLDEFIDKKILSFDARRIKWEKIASFTGIIGAWPSRLYIPKGLSKHELIQLKKRFEKISIILPHTGYYNLNTPGNFTPYQL